MAQPTRILFASRHVASDAQVRELTRVFGPVTIEKYYTRVSDGIDLVDFYFGMRYDEMVVVAPDRTICYLVKMGIKPLIARGGGYDGENDSSFRFSHFERVVRANSAVRHYDPQYTATYSTRKKEVLWISDTLITRAHSRELTRVLGKYSIKAMSPMSRVKDVLMWIETGKYSHVVAQVPLWYLARIKEVLPNDSFLLGQNAIPTKGMPDFLTVRKAKMKLIGFWQFTEAEWKTVKLAPKP